MCAIFSSKSFEEFNKLYKQNQLRGSAATSYLYLKFNLVGIVKLPKVVDLNVTVPDQIKREASVFVGHVQAPTSTAQEFNADTSHPFTCGDWVVAHNGVLTNFEALKLGIPETEYNEVDSSIIPALLKHSERYNSNRDEVDHIVSVLGMLKGTHTTWIFNKQSNNLYVARCGSTLYGNPETGTFSSTPTEGMIEMRDGNVYQVKDGFFVVGKFEAQSPFFII